jgi:hypothetical protein
MAAPSTSDFAGLVAEYWEYRRLSTSEVRADRLLAEATSQSAIEEARRIAADDDLAVPLLVALARAAPDEQALCYLGASLIEDVVSRGRPTGVLLDRIEGAARRDERLRSALVCVAWPNAAVRDRFSKLTGAQ